MIKLVQRSMHTNSIIACMKGIVIRECPPSKEIIYYIICIDSRSYLYFEIPANC